MSCHSYHREIKIALTIPVHQQNSARPCRQQSFPSAPSVTNCSIPVLTEQSHDLMKTSRSSDGKVYTIYTHRHSPAPATSAALQSQCTQCFRLCLSGTPRIYFWDIISWTRLFCQGQLVKVRKVHSLTPTRLHRGQVLTVPHSVDGIRSIE